MRAAARNFVVVMVALVPIAVIDYFFVKSGQDHSSIWWSPWINYPALSLAPLGFFWANWAPVRNSKVALLQGAAVWHRALLVAVLAIALSVVWFYFVAFPVVANL